VSLFRPRFHHGDILEVAGRRVVLKINPKARRISLRVAASGAEVVAVAPTERRLSEAAAFARERAAWIASRLAAQPQGEPFEPGAEIPFRGGRVRLERVPGASAARLVEDEAGVRIVSGGEGPAFARRVERLLRAEAQRQVLARTEVHVAALGLKAPKVSLADPKSRWGSCTPGRGTIRYSWRLILAPDRVLDYVAAHEVAHLVHGDHSARFWAVVRKLVGDEKPQRRWLRTHGPALHAVGRG
jgi:predicted metal-dependent hydrolase